MAVESVASKSVAPITPILSPLTSKTTDVNGDFAATLDKIEEKSSLSHAGGKADQAQSGGRSVSAKTSAAATPAGAVPSGYDSIAGYDSVAADGEESWAAADEDMILGADAALAAQSYGVAVAPAIDAKSFAADRGVDLAATLELIRDWMQASSAAGAGANDAASEEEEEETAQSAAAQTLSPASAAGLDALDLGQGRFALVPTGQTKVAADTPILDLYTNTVQPADRNAARPKPIVPAGLTATEQRNLITAFEEADQFGLLRNRADFLANLDGKGKPVRDPEELAQWIKSGKVGDPPLPLDNGVAAAAARKIA